MNRDVHAFLNPDWVRAVDVAKSIMASLAAPVSQIFP